MKKLRPVGDILLEMEPLLEELTIDHELQLGELLSLIDRWARIHVPGSVEEYEDGSSPVFKYE